MVHQLKTVLPNEFILSEPFHGVGSFYYLCRQAEQASQGSVHVSLVNAYEFDKRFLKFYKERDAKDSCNPRQACLSSMEDLTKFPMHVFEDSDFLVAGAPCQFVANNGKGLGEEDPRAKCFKQVVQLVIHLGRQGRLKGFALENSPNIMKRINGANTTFADKCIKKLNGKLSDWEFDVVKVDANPLPHHRPRAFIRGQRRDTMRWLSIEAPLQEIVNYWGDVLRVGLIDVLDPDLPHVDLDTLTDKRKKNVKDYMKAIGDLKKTKLLKHTHACFEVDRAFTGVYASTIYWDCTPPLRVKGPDTFVLSVGTRSEAVGEHTARFLSESERFLVAGQKDYSTYVSVGKMFGRQMNGNAYPSTMVFKACLPMLQAMALAKMEAKKKRQAPLRSPQPSPKKQRPC